ncbi:MAG: apolipoprotein N-acyltransferase [Phycisphaeraceae bacterium]|nr:apolipoprotein N-acyltransferase [Phycisphaeraceae bacterium]
MSEAPPDTFNQRYGIQAVSAHLAMCAATAVLLTLAFPLPGWSFMAFFALVPVGVLAMRTRRVWTLAWTSYAVFFAWWVLRVMWLRHVGGFAPIAIGVVCAGWFTVALVALALVQRRFKGAMTLTLPIFWCAAEIGRSLWPLGGFAWFLLGNSQAAWRVGEHPGYLVQSADLFGWVTVSFLVAMTSGVIIDLIARPLIKRHVTGKVRPRRTIMTAIVLWLGCIGSALVYGYQRLHTTPAGDEPGTEVVIGIVQTNVAQDNKIRGTPDQRAKDFDRLLELSESSAADHPKPALIVWPETMVTLPINDEMAALAGAGQLKDPFNELIADMRRRVQQHSDRFGIPLMVGSQARKPSEHEKSMNSALFVRPGSEGMARYSKMHLVPMGEYIPGPQWLRGLFFEHLSPYDYDYTVQPGEGIVIFEIDQADALDGFAPDGAVSRGSLRFASPICYEAAIATKCREMVYGNNGVKRADLLVNLTNDGWYVSAHQRYQHLQMAVMRCIENRVPMARSVNTGVSGMIDSAGRVSSLVTVGGEHQAIDGYVNAAVALDPRVTVYGRVREGAAVGICAAALLLLIGVLVPHTKTRQQ